MAMRGEPLMDEGKPIASLVVEQGLRFLGHGERTVSEQERRALGDFIEVLCANL